VGFATNWPSMSPIREAAIGPFHGMSEMASAALAPFTMAMSDSFFWSADIRMPMIWTSFRKPSGKSGRQGRSHRRDVRISFSEGRPSRLK
jgi:hypothetical protein